MAAMADYTDKHAILSGDSKYRYLLRREWRGTHEPKNWRWFGAKDGEGKPLGEPKAALFVMLNPSTADAEQDDPTTRRCVGFAKAWKFERLEVVNLFAYRATDPRALLKLGHDDDPVGWRNQEYIRDASFRAGLIVCAWGAHGAHLGQDETVLGWLAGDAPIVALARTKDGHPKHPLYIPTAAEPRPYR